METNLDAMNEAIGTFMGYKMYDKRYPRNHGIGAPEAEPEKCMIIQKAKYHSSWDCLMPVWEKLRESILSDFKGKYPMKLLAAQRRWKNCCAGVSIEAAHLVVYELIQWYNKQKEANNE